MTLTPEMLKEWRKNAEHARDTRSILQDLNGACVLALLDRVEELERRDNLSDDMEYIRLALCEHRPIDACALKSQEGRALARSVLGERMRAPFDHQSSALARRPDQEPR